MTPASALRARIGVVVLGVASTIFGIGYAAATVMLSTPPIGADPVSLHEARFAGLKAVLPPGATVGYISPEKITVANSEAVNEYELTQYDLAPVYLDQSTDHPLVVGNFYRGPVTFQPSDGAQWRVALNLGHGVALFRRQPR